MRSGGAGSAGARWACDGLNPERLAALPARHFRRPVLRSPANALRREADFALRRACAARSLCRTGVVSEAPERGAHRVVEAPPAGTALLPRSVPTRTARHGRRRNIPRIKWVRCQAGVAAGGVIWFAASTPPDGPAPNCEEEDWRTVERSPADAIARSGEQYADAIAARGETSLKASSRRRIARQLLRDHLRSPALIRRPPSCTPSPGAKHCVVAMRRERRKKPKKPTPLTDAA
jgi:hypothetical protein